MDTCIDKEKARAVSYRLSAEPDPLTLDETRCKEMTVPFNPSPHKKPRKKMKTPYKAYLCKSIDKFVRNKNHCERQERSHTGERPYVCSICNKAYSNSSNLFWHKRRSHSNGYAKRNWCPHPNSKCNSKKVYSNTNYLRRHMEVHIKGPRYDCNICGKKYSHEDSYRRHLLVESENKLVCHICRKKFYDESDAKKHLEVHIKYKKDRNLPFLVCKKRFPGSGGMHQHKCSKQLNWKENAKGCDTGDSGQDIDGSKFSFDDNSDGFTVKRKEIVIKGLTVSNASSEKTEGINNLNQDIEQKEKITELVNPVIENGDESHATDISDDSDSDQSFNDISASDKIIDNIKVNSSSYNLDLINSAGKSTKENVTNIALESCVDAMECNENDSVNYSDDPMVVYLTKHVSKSPAEAKHLECMPEGVVANATLCTSYTKSDDEVIKPETESYDGEIKEDILVSEIYLDIDEIEGVKAVDSINDGRFNGIVSKNESQDHANNLDQNYSESHKQFECRHCKVTFDLKDEYLQHLKVDHFRSSCVYCDKCGLKSKWRYAHKHICRVCENCNKVFNTSSAMKKHKDRTCKCKGCGKIFCSMLSLKTHEKMDMCKLVLPCNKCDKVFNTQSTYDTHQRWHAKYKNKPFRCEICDQGYEEYVYLKKHYLMHEGKFLCSYCKKKCYDQSHVELHQNTCPMSFKVKRNVNKGTNMNEVRSGSEDEEPKQLKSCLEASDDINHVENDRLNEKNVETIVLHSDDEDLEFDIPDIDEPMVDSSDLGTVDSEQLKYEVSGSHDLVSVDNDVVERIQRPDSVSSDCVKTCHTVEMDSVLVRNRNKDQLLVVSNDLYNKTHVRKKNIDIGKTISNSCDQNEGNSSETMNNSDITIKSETKPSVLEAPSQKDTKLQVKMLPETEKVILNDIPCGEEYVNEDIKLEYYLVNSSCDYQEGSKKSSMYRDSINNINSKDTSNDSNGTSYFKIEHSLEEPSSPVCDESETDFDTDTDDDSSGYEECPEEEVKEMVSEMQRNCYYKCL